MGFSSFVFLSGIVFGQILFLSASQVLFPCDYGSGLDPEAPKTKPSPKPSAVVKPKQPVKVFANECLENSECPISKYCYGDPGIGQFCPAYSNCQPTRCAPRLGVNKVCRIERRECAEGLYCGRDKSILTGDSVCLPKLSKGHNCSLYEFDQCTGDLECIVQGPNNGKCGQFLGNEGTKCVSNSHCDRKLGYICDFGPDFRESIGKCTRKAVRGDSCSRCAEACLTRYIGKGACMTRRKLGQLCKEDNHCAPDTDYWDRSDRAICNAHRRNGTWQGVCTMKSKLLRLPGLTCDPNQDACDSKRNLRCGKHNGSFVCMQKSKIDEPCVPDSPFSACDTIEANSALECRRPMLISNKTLFGRHLCLPVREKVKIGEICNFAEHAICEEGASCVKGRGILHGVGRRSSEFAQPVAYCLKPVPIGGDCNNKSATFCDKGSFCVNGTCAKAAGPSEDIPMFSGDGISCSSRPCAPGLSCESYPDRGKVCTLQTAVARPGEICSSPTKKIACEKGTWCIRGLEQPGVLRCHAPGGVGAPCSNEHNCKGRFQCRYEFGMASTCYDFRTTVPHGGKCIPKHSVCLKPKNDFRDPKCLRKGSSFTCQVEARLFESCSPAEDIFCSKTLTCSANSFCMPSEEVKA